MLYIKNEKINIEIPSNDPCSDAADIMDALATVLQVMVDTNHNEKYILPVLNLLRAMAPTYEQLVKINQ